MPAAEAFTDCRHPGMARILAIAGHDLRQPLHLAMMAMARAVEDGVSAAGADRLRIALDAMKRLDSELQDIARLSQLGGPREPVRRPVRMAEVMARLDREWRFYAEACRTELEISRTDLLAETDAGMLHTILRNLVGNAVKYAGPGGHVRVACRRLPGRVIVEVEDDGCGIAASRLDSIFSAFERGDQAGQSDGLGLGLAIVRQTADLLRHPVSVRSVVNEGSVFSIELPLCLPDAFRAGPGGVT